MCSGFAVCSKYVCMHTYVYVSVCIREEVLDVCVCVCICACTVYVPIIHVNSCQFYKCCLGNYDRGAICIIIISFMSETSRGLSSHKNLKLSPDNYYGQWARSCTSVCNDV